jgi:hypothetical protein
MLHFVVQSFLWLAALVVFMSFVEHGVHRRFMHRKSPLGKFITPLNKVFEHHAKLHHSEYSRVFSDAPRGPNEDHGIQLSLKEGFIETIPFAALLSIFSIQGAITLFVVVLGHHYIWNKIHLEMHQPADQFFSHWPIFKFLARHHFVHHKHPEKNFNVVFPIADYILGTNTHANESELNELRNIGLLASPVRGLTE